MSTFAALLRRHREAKRWSMDYLAMQANINHSLISRLESGERQPTAHSITKLTAALGLADVDADALWLIAGLVPPGLDADLVAQAIALLRAAKQRRLFDLFEKGNTAA